MFIFIHIKHFIQEKLNITGKRLFCITDLTKCLVTENYFCTIDPTLSVSQFEKPGQASFSGQRNCAAVATT